MPLEALRELATAAAAEPLISVDPATQRDWAAALFGACLHGGATIATAGRGDRFTARGGLTVWTGTSTWAAESSSEGEAYK
eukprot:6980681-Pyramimonas_sp.AAC.1